MAATHLFAGCAVADLAAARVFYEGVFGREADLVPNDRELCWNLGGGLWVYAIAGRGKAGGGIVTVLVDDLDAVVADCAARGVAPVEIRPEGPSGRKARFLDPDGNELAFAQVG
jgi:catechol 2,3-dioxygenase-like lactoylglutathione lyase family enzyme